MVTSLLPYRHQTFATATGVSQSLTFHSTPKAKHGDDEHSTTVDKTSQGSKGNVYAPFEHNTGIASTRHSPSRI